MDIILTFFILLLAVGTAWIATAALVQKRTMRRHREKQHSSNHAS